MIMASGPFWDTVTPSQDINNVRKYAARDAPVKLQAGAVKQGLRVDPTLLVVDLAPPTSAAGLIDLQKLCKQVSLACCSLVLLVSLNLAIGQFCWSFHVAKDYKNLLIT